MTAPPYFFFFFPFFPSLRHHRLCVSYSANPSEPICDTCIRPAPFRGPAAAPKRSLQPARRSGCRLARGSRADTNHSKIGEIREIRENRESGKRKKFQTLRKSSEPSPDSFIRQYERSSDSCVSLLAICSDVQPDSPPGYVLRIIRQACRWPNGWV